MGLDCKVQSFRSMANPHPTGRRKAGVPNKFSSERAAAVERAGKRLPPANLLIIAENSMAMAAKFQPGPKDSPNREFDEAKYAFWLNQAREASGGSIAGVLKSHSAMALRLLA
jgi:hypothetical protein